MAVEPVAALGRHNSSRTMFMSRGASIPTRTALGPMRTIVMAISSPIKMRSPGFLESTNIARSPLLTTQMCYHPEDAIRRITGEVTPGLPQTAQNSRRLAQPKPPEKQKCLVGGHQECLGHRHAALLVPVLYAGQLVPSNMTCLLDCPAAP